MNYKLNNMKKTKTLRPKHSPMYPQKSLTTLTYSYAGGEVIFLNVNLSKNIRAQ